jgi:AraC-like DNA-binding protein
VHLFLFFKPRGLYGISQGEAVNISNDVLQNLPSYNTEKPIEQNCFPKPEARISNEKTFCDEFANLVYYRPKLEDYMSSAQPFLKQGYSIQDLSREINIPQHHLSALLNRVYKLRFTDYINGMRIRFIEENLGKPDWENLTLEGIAKQAGFTSRTTFFNAIKKTVGVTPSEFMAQLKKQQPKINSLL